MEIYIDNKPVAIKSGTSIEFHSENRLFSSSDSYTLSITLPLRDCPQNIAVFGHINRADVLVDTLRFDCQIRDRAFFKSGTATIIELSDTEVKIQFLEGRSAQNFDVTLEDIFINELDLGYWPDTPPAYREEGWAVTDPMATRCVALPWVNNSSGNMQNEARWDAGSSRYLYQENKNPSGSNRPGGHATAHEIKSLSWQPYLIYLTKRIAEAIGYAIDLTPWLDSDRFKYLLVCNTLPYAWDITNFARALPHWSVKEYFQKLELLLGAAFDFNHLEKTIDFAFYGDLLADIPPVELTKCVEEYSSEFSERDDSDCDYIESRNISYADNSSDIWKYHSCHWFIKQQTGAGEVISFDSMEELLAKTRQFKTWDGGGYRGDAKERGSLYYVRNLDTYFVIRAIKKNLVMEYSSPRPNRYNYDCVLQPVNCLGPRIVDDREDADTQEIEFVPVPIDETDDEHGRCMFLDPGSFDESDESTVHVRGGSLDANKQDLDAQFHQPNAAATLEKGEKDSATEYYDKIFIGHWDGNNLAATKSPFPIIEEILISDDWSGYVLTHYSLRINDRFTRLIRGAKQIDPLQKTSFKFLSDNLPDPKSVFYIRGKRYLCEKITATFTENGMSQLLKGVFYPIIDD